MKKEYDVPLILLDVVICVRALAQFIIAASSDGLSFRVAYVSIGIVYCAAFVGLVMKKKWAPLLVVIFALADLLTAVWIGGSAAVGAAIMDLLILWLGYLAYRKFPK